MLKTLAVPFALMLASAAAAQEAKPASPIVVAQPWVRATPKGAPVVGGYATLTNKGPNPDHLVAASLEGTAQGEIHTMSMENGVMHMQRLADGLALAPGATVTLVPGGNHLMFMQPTAQLKEGATVKGSLTFANAGTIPVTFAVGGIAAKAAPGAMAMHDMPGNDTPSMNRGGKR